MNKYLNNVILITRIKKRNELISVWSKFMLKARCINDLLFNDLFLYYAQFSICCLTWSPKPLILKQHLNKVKAKFTSN